VKDITISNKLREMARYRMTREELAKMAGITRQAISNQEREISTIIKACIQARENPQRKNV